MSPSRVDYRCLDAGDGEAYRALRLASYKESPFAFSESFEDECLKQIRSFAEELAPRGDPPDRFMLGAVTTSGDLIGFVKFRRDLRSKARHKAMIHAMYVDPAHRRRGIGRQLVRRTLDMARAVPGLEQVHLWVLHASGSVAGFYRACGFVSQGTVVRNDLKMGDRYVDAEYMVLDLPGSPYGGAACTDSMLLDALCRSFFAAFSNAEARRADLSILERLFVPGAVLFSRRSQSDAHGCEPLPQFIRDRQRILDDGTLTSFREFEVDAATTIQAGVAQRRSLYEKSGCRQGAWFRQRGTKLFQFVKTNAEWRICSVLWEDEPIVPLDPPDRPSDRGA